MNFFLAALTILSIACAVTSANPNAALIKALAKPCQTSENASDDDLDNLVAMKPPTTQEGKCLAACMGKQFGMFTEDYKLEKDVFVSGVAMKDATKKDEAGEIADACADVTDDDRCEAAEKVWQCIVNEAETRGWETTAF